MFKPIEVEFTPTADFQPIEREFGAGEQEAAPVADDIKEPTTGKKEN